MKTNVWRFLVSAIASLTVATAPALAQGVVDFTFKNNGPQTIAFKIATNCFLDTPKEFTDFTQLAPGYTISFATSTDTCKVQAATYNLWFMTQDLNRQLYNFNLSMWETPLLAGSASYNEICEGTEQVPAVGRYRLAITFDGFKPTCAFLLAND